MPKIAVIGTTAWGITLGVVLARNKHKVWLWARTEEEAAELTCNGAGSHLIPGGAAFPASLSVTSSLDLALDRASAVFLVVPSQRMRQNIKMAAGHLRESTLIVSAAKGLEIGSAKRMSEVIVDEIDPRFQHNICVISGPNLAPEIMQNLPAATVVAAEDEVTARKAQRLLSAPDLCVYTNSDVTGVELGGALKNIIALGAGIADGLGYGDNAKAALITRGLTEMTALGVSLGANPLTFSGLAGLGDLIATCASPLSRNHYVGEQLAKGRPLKEITGSMTGIAEGISTTLAVWKIAQEKGLGMPITETIYHVLYDGADIQQSAASLMGAAADHELAGRKWRLFSFLRRKKRSPVR
ncbi:MAG: NAD(P)-dependent glycerol-3-phosphate dehydrogenase [Chloroflexi bacterium]|nr:NAD(P)-dependent glycerol-3-phosphate dehydrogenase [Chloroflexota bacterium]